MPVSPPSPRVQLRRYRERGAYDRATIYGILDAMPLAHVGYTVGGTPFVTPTLVWRNRDRLFWHGSAASRMLGSVDGSEVCVAITIIEGMVLARSAFHHSINYKSVMLFGQADKVVDVDEKASALRRLIDGLFPGRWEVLRPVKLQELKATSVMTMPISEASAKIRSGPPIEDEEDRDPKIWAGVVPVKIQTLRPIADDHVEPGLRVPEHATRFEIG